MDLSSITGQSTQSQKATARIAEDFDTFLVLLTTQLQNQDPLSPLDTNEFTSQLVQFASVEQTIQTNKNLEALVSLTASANAGSAVSYLGTQITVEGNQTSLKDGAAQWHYDLAGSANQTSLIVEDATGKVVYVTSGQLAPGKHTFDWDGKDNAGNPLPDGNYKLKVTATGKDNESVGVTQTVGGIVTGVDFDENEPLLVVNGTRYSLLDVITIKEPSSAE